MDHRAAFRVGDWVRYTGPCPHCALVGVAPGALGQIIEHAKYGQVVRFLVPIDAARPWRHWDVNDSVGLVIIATTPSEEELTQWTIATLST